MASRLHPDCCDHSAGRHPAGSGTATCGTTSVFMV